MIKKILLVLFVVFMGSCTIKPQVVRESTPIPSEASKSISTGVVAVPSPILTPVIKATKAIKSKKSVKKGDLVKKERIDKEISVYMVKTGDCLWNIAKKEEIYNDPWCWPLIYKQNKGQIENPNLIYEDQPLNILVNPTDKEKGSAKKQAEKFGEHKK